ncbi:MAG: hypothetical protein AB9866_08270 [Syntrophobacteraceae bacterium]
MKRWIIFVLFSIFLSYPTLSGAGTDHFDRGQSTFFDVPLMKIPVGGKPESRAATEKQGEGEEKSDQDKEKEAMDKKVDDAIKKAWEGK